MATVVRKNKSVKSKLNEVKKSSNEREELIQLLSDTTNFEKSELKKMSMKELKDLHDSMEIPEWEEELEREKGNTGMKENGGTTIDLTGDLYTKNYPKHDWPMLEYLKSIGYKQRPGNFSTEDGIDYYIGDRGNKAIVVAFITDEDVYMIYKKDAREMSSAARTAGTDHVELHTNYGVELSGKDEKPQIVGFDKIVKVSKMKLGGKTNGDSDKLYFNMIIEGYIKMNDLSGKHLSGEERIKMSNEIAKDYGWDNNMRIKFLKYIDESYGKMGNGGRISVSEIKEIIKRYNEGGAYDVHENVAPAVIADIILHHKNGETPKEIYNEINGIYDDGGEIPFDLWEEYSRPEKVKFLESIKKPTALADYEWNELPKTIRDKFEEMAMTPTVHSDKDRVEVWYDSAEESEVDEVLRELGWKPYKFKTSQYRGGASYPAFDKLGVGYISDKDADKLRKEIIEYVMKNKPKVKEYFSDEEETIDDIIPIDIKLKNGGKTKMINGVKHDVLTIPDISRLKIDLLDPDMNTVYGKHPLGDVRTDGKYGYVPSGYDTLRFDIKEIDKFRQPEIKGIGKFIPIAKIKEITEYFDNHKKPHAGEDPSQAEGYAWLGAMEKYSILGDSTIVDKILAEHTSGKSLMDIHKVIKKMEDGGKAGDLSRSLQEILDQSKNTIEHRYLLGRMDKDEYETKLGELKSFAENRGLEFEHGGKTKQKVNLYFPDDKLDYTNEMLISNGWATVGGRIEDFHEILKTKGREKAYAEIKKQYEEGADAVYRSLLVLDRIEKMGVTTSALYSDKLFLQELNAFQKDARKKYVKAGEYNHYLVSKPVLEWDNTDYDNALALKLKHEFADGGKTESNDIIQQLINDGFINKDHTLTNKGRRIADLHKYCFPIGAHPFSYAQYTVDDLYSKPKYVTINDIIYYTDGFLVYELGGHLSDALRDSAVQDHSLENSVNKTISKNLVEYNPYAYCPGVSFEDKSGKVEGGEGFIVFSNLNNSNELYVNSLVYNYIVRNYRIDKWMADSKGGSLIHAVSNGVTQAIILVNSNAVGVNPSFTLFDRDKLMSGLRNKYAELFIKGKNYKDFISGWKESEVPEDLKKPADIEATIRGLEVLLEYAEDEAEIKNLNAEIYKLKKSLK